MLFAYIYFSPKPRLPRYLNSLCETSHKAFKWFKQQLYIQEFYGFNEKAVRIQIHVAIIAYNIAVILANDIKVKMDTYYMLRILSTSLPEKTPLREMLLNVNEEEFKQNDSAQLMIQFNIFF